jgi:hypothetical protein
VTHTLLILFKKICLALRKGMWRGEHYRKSDQLRKARGIKQEGAGRSINIHRPAKKFTIGPGDKLYKRAPGAPKKMKANIHNNAI